MQTMQFSQLYHIPSIISLFLKFIFFFVLFF